LAESSDDNSLARDLIAVESLRSAVVFGLDQLLDLFGRFEQASFIFGSRKVVKCEDCRRTNA